VDGLGVCSSSGPKENVLHKTKNMTYDHIEKKKNIGKYLFNFAFENTIEPGYVTEKPFDALVSGKCVSVYFIYMYMYMCMYNVGISIQIYKCIYICIYIYIYTLRSIYIYAYIYTHIYIYIYRYVTEMPFDALVSGIHYFSVYIYL
jgi:hypothetical protein